MIKSTDLTFPCYVVFAQNDSNCRKIGHNSGAAIYWQSNNSGGYVEYKTGYISRFYNMAFNERGIGCGYYIVDANIVNVIYQYGPITPETNGVIFDDLWGRITTHSSVAKNSCPICHGTGIEKITLLTSVKEYPCSACKNG